MKKTASAKSEEKIVRLMIPSTFGYEKIAMNAAAELAEIAGIPPDRSQDLCTATAEACINAMQHGNKMSPTTSVDILYYLKDNTLEIEIYDHGAGIQKHPPKPVLERKLSKKDAPRGWGIFLIENLVDQVEFGISSRHGHVTRLIMKLQPAEVV
ncbi:MAG: ATP-binding protein [Deferribacteres bacterium]|nr:ATP-binding protein [candidate division KSB1 bacterium]MCB9510083.1 ATP-binding protein [Deferribacteres bacterium]